MSWFGGVSEYVGSTGVYVGSVLSSYTSAYYAATETTTQAEGTDDSLTESPEIDEDDFVALEVDEDEGARHKLKGEKEKSKEVSTEYQQQKIEKRMLDRQEKVVGCFEPGCDTLFGWTTGYRICAGCERHFCYRHCNFIRRFATVSNAQSAAKFVCCRCNNRHPQTLGTNTISSTFKLTAITQGRTKDLTAKFAERRESRDRTVEKQTDIILSKLEQISLEKYEKDMRKQKRKERKLQEYEENGLTAASAIEAVGEILIPVLKSPAAISSWLVLPNDKICPYCKEEFGYLNYNKYLCNLCNGVCCQNCCKYVSMGRSQVNRKVPAIENGKLISCKRCSGLIVNRERKLNFDQLRKVSREHLLRIQVEEITAMQRKLSNTMTAYFDIISAATMLSEFELVEEEGLRGQKGRRENAASETELCDEPEIEWHDESQEEEPTEKENNSKPKGKTEEQAANDEKQQALHKQLVALLLEYQKLVKAVMGYPPRNRTEAKLMFSVKTALWDYQNENLLPLQMSIPAMIPQKEEEHSQQVAEQRHKNSS